SVAGVPVAKLDTEVTDKTAFHSILVGGPAVNRLTASAMGKAYPSTGTDSGVPENAAMLRLVENAFGGTKTALIVAGWSASNTRDASTVLKDFASYADKLKGKDVTVTSSAGVITVSAPSVA
ncbi:MAG: S-layer protein, partial [DPANN group archaeon]|nr:S-layer protein [DPANN group archaeon]